MINLFSTYLIVIYSVFFGITMKYADLLDEHGLKLFKGSKILFGILWGFFGSLLIISNPIIANVLLAMVLVYLVRMRIDYVNHCIAAVMMILSFILFQELLAFEFIFFALFFLVFGSMKDYFQDKKIKKNIFYKTGIWFYPISTLIYGFITNNFLPFLSLTVYNLSYAVIKIYYQKSV